MVAILDLSKDSQSVVFCSGWLVWFGRINSKTNKFKKTSKFSKFKIQKNKGQGLGSNLPANHCEGLVMVLKNMVMVWAHKLMGRDVL